MLEKINSDKYDPLLIPVAGIVSGISAACKYGSFTREMWWYSIPVISIFLLIAALRFIPHNNCVLMIFTVLSAFSSGFCWYNCKTNYFSENHIAIVAPVDEIAVLGRLVSLPEESRDGGFLELETIGIETSAGSIQKTSGCVVYYLSEQVWKYIYQNKSFIPGTILRIEAPLKVPRGYINPGRFDPAKQMEHRGIYRSGIIEYPEFIRIVKVASPWSFAGAAGILRMKILLFLDSVKQPMNLTENISGADIKSVSKALLIGSKREISPDINRLFREAGLVHLLAISGLHVAVIAAFLSFILSQLPGTIKTRCFINIIFIWFYAFLTGGSASVIRAASIITLFLSARMMHRTITLLHAIACTIVILLIYNPALIEDPGFQLTFAATTGIALLYTPLSLSLKWIPFRWVRNALAISLAAQTATAPISALWFNRIGFLGFITGLPLIPLASLCLVSGVIFIAFAWIPIVNVYLGKFHSFCIAVLIMSAQWEMKISGVTFEVTTVSLCCACMIFGAVLIWGCLRLPRWMLLVSAILMPLGLKNIPQAKPLGFLEMWFLDVGNADCTVTRLPDGKIVMVDAGGIYDSEFDVGEKIVLRTLRTLGINKIDIAVITHPHPDHQLGMKSVLRSMPPQELWIADRKCSQEDFQKILSSANRKDIDIHSLEKRNIFNIFPMNTNNHSIVLAVSYGRFRALLAADVESEIEDALLEYSTALKSTLLKAPHHGSRTSSSEVFLKAVSPDIITIPCGANNQFDHPHYSVLKRIHTLLPDTKILRSDLHGIVHLKTDGHEVYIDWMTEESAG